MPDLFGIDIAGEIYKGFKGQMLTGTLKKKTSGTRTPGSLTAGTNPTSADHTFEGFIEDKDEVRIGGTLVSKAGKFVAMFGASIDPVTVPEQGDEVVIESTTYKVVELAGRDPAAALYILRVEE